MSSGILPSFLGALQASMAVLLTISYGVLASRFNILKDSSAKDMSTMCVKVFLPALLITNVGSELHADTVYKYVPVLIWALVYTLSSMGLGWVLKRVFKFPAWTIPAICFNNTTALPLLLIQSLATAGILDDLKRDSDDTSSAAVSRAKSYFLASAIIGNCLTFAIGPKLLDDEEAPESHKKATSAPQQDIHQDDEEINGAGLEHRDNNGRSEGEEDTCENPRNRDGRTAGEEEDHDNETTTLLPKFIARRMSATGHEAEAWYQHLPHVVQNLLGVIGMFVNAPIIGAIIGCTLGVAPPLHRIFFNKPSNGGIFNAWLTESVSNIGSIFAPLQLVIVGAKLSSSLMKMKKGEEGGAVPYAPMLTIFFIRFILWPILSIGTIFLIASKTSWLAPDPVLWFVLMLMPTGPPATKLVSLADVSGSDEDEKMSIAKFLALSYAISPIICLAVVGSLKATLAVEQ